MPGPSSRNGPDPTNLAQVLETGLDKRIFDRPVLGINIDDLNEGIAKTMGVPVNAGIRLDFLPEKMGAYQAGLRKDDIIIELDGKSITNDLGSLLMAIQGKKGGDKVEVVFYRGPEKKTLTMELTKRPAPQNPWEPEELAKAIRAKYDEGLAALEKACTNGSEVDADQELAPDEWSAKEVLAHLIQSERHWLENLEDVDRRLPTPERQFGPAIALSMSGVFPTAVAYKTVQGLLEEMKRLSDEMVAYVSSLPAEFTARKASYFQLPSCSWKAPCLTFFHIEPDPKRHRGS